MENECQNDFSWIDEDCAEFEKYDFWECTLEDIKEFFKAKKEFLENPNEDTRYMMKYRFQIAHSVLKSECSCHSISPSKLQELTEILSRWKD